MKGNSELIQSSFVLQLIVFTVCCFHCTIACPFSFQPFKVSLKVHHNTQPSNNNLIIIISAFRACKILRGESIGVYDILYKIFPDIFYSNFQKKKIMPFVFWQLNFQISHSTCHSFNEENCNRDCTLTMENHPVKFLVTFIPL